ncbi:hypothetical protein JTB14_029231 [Gonioctena quinquepunctata]|nr:hypothetical protein JTB14_029231 [Gonioctena quinquepunctata]
MLGLTIKILQTKSIDKHYANLIMQNTLTVLKERRENSEGSFNNLYKNIAEIHEKMGKEISVRRLTERQTKRSNIKTNNEEDYFRITVYNPILDNVTQNDLI